MSVRRAISSILLAALSAVAAAQDMDSPITIDSITVSASIHADQVGVQKTVIGEHILKEDIALSMADILSENSVAFIKSYGRGTMSTASVRGTSPSHTRVTWNGLGINSPMLGMVDFSLIPSYLIDRVDVYHGGSSTQVASGAMGGAVSLRSSPLAEPGIRYIQGIGSYSTFDQFLSASYGRGRLRGTTRALLSLSENDFPYTNYSKLRQEVRDASGRVVSYDYPKERNREGDWKDIHILQDLVLSTRAMGEIGAHVWYLSSHRGVPVLNVNYRDEGSSSARQNETDIRAVVTDRLQLGRVSVDASLGYSHTDMDYTYRAVTGLDGTLTDAIASRSRAGAFQASVSGIYARGTRLHVSAEASFSQYLVDSRDESVVQGTSGYRKGRPELSLSAKVNWRPSPRLGMGTTLREDMYGGEWTPPVPSLFAEWLPFDSNPLKLKASVTRNSRYPTLNDLYYMPGGNPDLRPESGLSMDAGAQTSFSLGWMSADLSLDVYDSHIDDWIMWRPTFKGFYTPVNISRVHSYGIEARTDAAITLGRGWNMDVGAMLTTAHSVNMSEKVSESDVSYGHQLPYIPVLSASLTCTLRFSSWRLCYMWNHYGERYTTSAQSDAVTGTVCPYFMSDVSLSRELSLRPAHVVIRAEVRNLLDEEYESVLSHPMPGRNFSLSLSVSPRFR